MGVGDVTGEAFCFCCPRASCACVVAGSTACGRAVIEVAFDAGAGVVIGEEDSFVSGGAGCTLGYGIVAGHAGVVAGQSLAGCFDWVLFYFSVAAVAAAEGGEKAGGITCEATGGGRRGAGFALMLTSSTVICICNVVEFVNAGAAAISSRGA